MADLQPTRRPGSHSGGFVLGLSLKEAVFLTALSALVVAAKVVFRFPVKLPGHSNLFILFFMVTGRLAVGRTGAGVYMGLVSGVLLAVTGQSREGAWVFFKYLAPGVMIDGVGVVLWQRTGWWVGLTMGVLGGASRAVVSYAIKVGMGVDQNVGLALLLFMLATHIPFGAVGGLLSVPILNRLRRAGVVHFGQSVVPPPEPPDAPGNSSDQPG